jgi:hypothetical protein
MPAFLDLSPSELLGLGARNVAVVFANCGALFIEVSPPAQIIDPATDRPRRATDVGRTTMGASLHGWSGDRTAISRPPTRWRNPSHSASDGQSGLPGRARDDPRRGEIAATAATRSSRSTRNGCAANATSNLRRLIAPSSVRSLREEPGRPLKTIIADAVSRDIGRDDGREPAFHPPSTRQSAEPKSALRMTVKPNPR